VSRVFISDTFTDDEGVLYNRQLAEWDDVGVRNIQETDEYIKALPYEAAGYGRWRELLSSGQIIASHVRDLPERERTMFEGQDVLSIVVVPIFVGATWWGVIGFDECRAERHWSEDELALLRTAASTVGVAVQREQIERALEVRVAALAEISAALVVDQPLPDLLDRVLSVAVAASGARGACVVAREAGRLRTVRAHAMSQEQIAEAAGPGGGTARLALPLESNGRELGTLVFVFPEGHAPSDDETRFLSAVANQAAVAMVNDDLMRIARRHATTLERQRLARDLHDSVSQGLFSMTLHARAAQLAMVKEGLPADSATGRSVAQLRELTQDAFAEMRALIFELRPDALAEEGFLSAVTKQAAAITVREELPIEVHGPAERLGLDIEVEEHLYRITLEALHNIVKHARASSARVDLRVDGALLSVTVEDDGVGFDPDAAHPGHLGLTTMRTRAQAIGADLDVASAPGRGTRLCLRLPLPEPTASPEGAA